MSTHSGWSGQDSLSALTTSGSVAAKGLSHLLRPPARVLGGDRGRPSQGSRPEAVVPVSRNEA